MSEPTPIEPIGELAAMSPQPENASPSPALEPSAPDQALPPAPALNAAAAAPLVGAPPTPTGVPTKYCFACGTLLDARAEICPKCGVRQAPPQQSFEAATAHTRRITAGLLGIFLGAFGIHKFYLGRTAQGIVFVLAVVLTAGIGALITGLIGLIEGIIYLTMSDEHFEARFPRKQL